jgi:hypothetical protein
MVLSLLALNVVCFVGVVTVPEPLCLVGVLHDPDV